MKCPACGRPISLLRVAQTAIDDGHHSVRNIRNAVRKAFPKASDKEIGNALAYLVRWQIVQHTGYGKYAPMPNIRQA